MRYELSDYEWAAIRPMLPDKARGVPRVDDRRVLDGIFWALRSGAPWRDLPNHYGPYTTCYNRFVRWRRAGVWGRIMGALAAAHDAGVQMIDTSIVRVHQHAACIAPANNDAAIVHDYLYWTQTRTRTVSDEIFKFSAEDFNISRRTIQTIYKAVRFFGEGAWNENARLKADGERRILKRFPATAQINWADWKQRSDVFSNEN